MASLRFTSSRGDQCVVLGKNVTSIGSGLENDIRIEHASVHGRHAHVLKDGTSYRLFGCEGAPVHINGRSKSEHVLADGDAIDFGEVRVSYHAGGTTEDARALSATMPKAGAKSTDRASSISDAIPLEALRELYRFSAKIQKSPTLAELEANLVDAVVELLDADTGFFLLVEPEGTHRLHVARDCEKRDIPIDGAKISDSIVKRVIEKREPVLIADALSDSPFSESASVIDYKLRSVVAVPLTLEDRMLGVLYFGCNRRPSAFTREFLEIITVFASQAALLAANAETVDALRERTRVLEHELDTRMYGEIVAGCDSMQAVFKTLGRVAPTDISVLVCGETGTGKELIAEEIHRRSPRASGPFIALNMSAIPENLLEAELFGHVRGAFTGAVANRRGKFLEASGGTLFLDEIGDMPVTLQSKLLRVLQERTIAPIGSNTSIPIDIRIVSATNRDIDEMQTSGSFRADLYFRLDEVRITLPPLRERGDDIVLLAKYFLAKYAEQLRRTIRGFTPRAAAAMKQHRWRGNVRELEARVKKAVVMCDSRDIDIGDLELEEGAIAATLTLRDAKEAFAQKYIREILALNDGNRSKTARDLGVDPRTIFKYLEGR